MYPLFVHNIGALLYHPSNQTRANAVMTAAERRKQEQIQMRNIEASGLPSLHQHHLMQGSIGGSLPGPQHSIASHPSVGRPGIDRQHTFPTPPTSASSIIGNVGSYKENFQWCSSGTGRGSQGLSIDTSLGEPRSAPTTPATTPPGDQIQSMQRHHQAIQSYAASQPNNSQFKRFYTPEKMHGMDEIRQIVLERLSSTQALSALSGLDEGEPKRKRARRDDSRLGESRNTKQSSDVSTHDVKAKFRVLWKAKEFLQQQFEGSEGNSLGSVITLTGTARYAQALTVREYLGQHWPMTGPRLLELIEKAIKVRWDTTKVFSDSKSRCTILVMNLGLRGPADHLGMRRDARLSLRYFPDQELLIQVEDTPQTVVEIAQQLAWLGCVLRTSQNGQLGRSQPRISTLLGASENQITQFDLHFAVDALPPNEECCWHDLFINPVIAYNFPISGRGEELGLEISLPMMAALGGASRAVEFEGGILLKGFSSAFVPLKKSGESIQWHYIRNKDGSRLSYWEADKRCPGRPLSGTIDRESLKSTRAFLGWWETTTTHLGAADVNYDNLDWCPTREPGRSANFSGGSIGFQNFVTGEMNFSVGPKDSKLHISRTGCYEKIVEHALITPVVLYDSVERRGWLVPCSAVIAHIVQKKHSRKPFRVEGKRINIIPVDPTLNVYEASENMLLANGKIKLRDSDSAQSAFCVKNLVFDIWTLLECLMDKDVKRETSADPEVRLPMSKTLRGWEFMDLVVERSPIRQKETGIKNTSGNWIDLAADINAVVLFASGFENLIRPAEGSTSGMCHAWKQVPKDRDYLVAGVPILNSLYEQAGSRLTKEHLTSTHIQWSRGPKLFEKCNSAGHFQCNCDRLQSLVLKSRLTSVVQPEHLKETGAVIFGQAKHSFSHNFIRQGDRKETALYSQQNAPFMLQTNLPESFCSTTSTERGSGSLPSLGSGKTISSSSDSESDGTNRDGFPQPKTENGSRRTPKRPRDEPERTFSNERSIRRSCRVQQYPRKTSMEAVVEILTPDDAHGINVSNSTPQYAPRSLMSTQRHSIRRKPKLHTADNVPDGTGRELYVGEETTVHSHVAQEAR